MSPDNRRADTWCSKLYGHYAYCWRGCYLPVLFIFSDLVDDWNWPGGQTVPSTRPTTARLYQEGHRIILFSTHLRCTMLACLLPIYCSYLCIAYLQPRITINLNSTSSIINNTWGLIFSTWYILSVYLCKFSHIQNSFTSPHPLKKRKKFPIKESPTLIFMVVTFGVHV